MIDCPVFDCGEQFVYSILLGRHLRRRHAFDGRRPVDDPGNARGEGCGDANPVGGAAGGGDTVGGGGEDAGSVAGGGMGEEDGGPHPNDLGDDCASSVGTSDGESSDSDGFMDEDRSEPGDETDEEGVLPSDDTGSTVAEDACSETCGSMRMGAEGESSEPADDVEDHALSKLYSLAARHHPGEVDIGAGDLGASLCGQVWDYYNALPCASNSVYHPATFASSHTHVSAFRSPATRQFLFHVCTSGGTGVSKGEVARLYRLCRRVEDGTGSTTRPIKDAFKSPTAIKEAVQKEKKRLLQSLGWKEADAPTVLGPQRIIFRSGMAEVMKAVASAPVIRWERGGGTCNCREGVRYDRPNCDTSKGSVLQGDPSNVESPRVERGCRACTPELDECGEPRLSPMQNDDVLRDCFDGKAYEAQRADVLKVLGMGALMLALALYSDGTVVTTSGGKTCHLPPLATIGFILQYVAPQLRQRCVDTYVRRLVLWRCCIDLHFVVSCCVARCVPY